MAEKVCVYKKIHADGWGATWKTSCGHKVYCASPEEVGMNFPPLPNEDGEFCHHCGKRISI